MLTDTEVETQHKIPTWRQHWFVENCLTPIPIVGPFFKTSNTRCALQQAGKSAGMLFGGTAYMMLNVSNMQMDDTPERKFGKMLLDMAVGMTLGVISYNVVFGAGKKLKDSCSSAQLESGLTNRLVK